jgi:TPR repeat protein
MKWKKNYMSAIKLGNIQAMVELADFYSEEVDSPMDQRSAQKYYKMAIEKGNVEAMRKLGYFYHYTDRNCEYNADKIKKYYSMAIENGDVEAMYLMNKFYHWDENEEKMNEYSFMAHEKGHKYALKTLLQYYQNKANQYVKNIEEYGEDYKKCIAKMSEITNIVSPSLSV